MVRWALIAIALTLSNRGDAQSNFEADRYERLTYDYEVAAYCGLLTRAVETVYRRKRQDLETASGASTEVLRQLRLRALAGAAREYDNRGLGGHRAWCNAEGRAGVARILAGQGERNR